MDRVTSFLVEPAPFGRVDHTGIHESDRCVQRVQPVGMVEHSDRVDDGVNILVEICEPLTGNWALVLAVRVGAGASGRLR